MPTYRRIAVALVLTFALPVAAAADPKPVDLKALAESGARAEKKLESHPASWTVVNTLQSGAEIHVSVVRVGAKQRTIFEIKNAAGRVEVFRVISRDGLWYVTDRSGSYKFRPFEAPTDTPFIYLTMNRSEPVFITSPEQLSSSKFVAVKGGVAEFRTALAPAQAAQLKAIVEQIESMARQTGKPLSPELQEQQEMLKDVAAQGTPVRVDLASGRMIEFGTQKLKTHVTDFRFLPQADDEEFAVAGRKWQDNSDDPTTGDLDDLTMITHQPGLQPGQKNYDTDGRLMDVKTGRFRRLPFPGGVVMPGCFLGDRRSVIVCGLDFETGSLRPYEIDLKTCQCDPLGSPLLDSGHTLFADLSPDGRTIAVTHVDATAGLLKAQVCLIDLATRKAKTLGEPLDTTKAFWTADGRHLAMLSRAYKDLNSPSINSLAIMDMDGKVSVLRRGNSLVLLADRKTMLFKDDDSGLWNTCDLQGENVQLFAGGLKGYGFPAPAPDGKRLLMMYFVAGKLPEPVVLRIGESEGRVITPVKGLWAVPQWR